MFRAVEPSMTFEYHRAHDPAQRGLRLKTAKVPAPLQVLPPRAVRLYRHSPPDLVPIQYPDLAQRPGVASLPASPPRLH
jgi:hypothetical protein